MNNVRIKKGNTYAKNLSKMRKIKKEIIYSDRRSINFEDQSLTKHLGTLNASMYQSDMTVDAKLNTSININNTKTQHTLRKLLPKPDYLPNLSSKKLLRKIPRFKNGHITLGEKFTSKFLETLSHRKEPSSEQASTLFITNNTTDYKTTRLPFVNSHKTMPESPEKLKTLTINTRIDNTSDYNHRDHLKHKYSNYRSMFRKQREVQISNWTKNLANNLSRISPNYGSMDSLRRFHDDPKTDHLFNTMSNYQNYRVAKINHEGNPQKRLLLPLKMIKDPAITKLSDNIFNFHKNFKHVQ